MYRIIFLVLISSASFGQVMQVSNGSRVDQRYITTLGFRLPQVCWVTGNPNLLNYSAYNSKGAMVYDTCAGKIKRWDGSAWVSVQDSMASGGGGDYVDTIYRKAGQDSIFYTVNGGTERAILDSTGGGSTDTTSLSNRINLKLNLSDTAAMLLPYRHWTQGYLTAADIAGKLNISDTASMLAGYLQGIGAGTNISIDNTNPKFPVISASGGGSGSTEYVVSGLGIKVDSAARVYTVNSDTANGVVLSRQRAANTYALIGASGVTGSGASEQITYWTGASVIGGNANFKYKPANNVLYFGGITPAAWNSAFNANLESNSSHIGLYNPGGVFLNANAYFDGTWKYKTTGVANHLYLFGGELKYRTAVSGSANAAITFTERLHIGNNGRVGINVSAPAELLHVKDGRVMVETSSGSGSSEYLMNTTAGQIGGFSAIGPSHAITHWRNNLAYGATNSAFLVGNALASGPSGTTFISIQPGGNAASNQRVRFYDAGAKFGTSEVNSAPVASALIEMESTTKGLLIPRMTGNQAQAISSPAQALMVFTTAAATSGLPDAVGWWGWNGSAWEKLNN